MALITGFTHYPKDIRRRGESYAMFPGSLGFEDKYENSHYAIFCHCRIVI